MSIRTAAIEGETGEQSVVDRIIVTLRQGVAEGTLAPGQRLVEVDLTRRFGVSRGPVREALRRLVAEGLLSLEHNKGIAVRQMSRKEIADLYKIREVLEGLAAKLAAAIDNKDRKSTLKDLRTKMLTASTSSDWHNYFDLNQLSHALIAQMSDNPQLLQMIRQLDVHFFRLPFRRLLAPKISVMHSGLDSAIEAVLKGDGEKAQAAMAAHVRVVAEATNSMPDSYFSVA
ncbi:transcriptional regulator, GntR family [Rhizobiales bacterium GAS113]|jgi:DNA-binding GntR family transcriptional regulator|nr:transcriptional regulator, GntR family [Rhizobiales bacterium GAS113]